MTSFISRNIIRFVLLMIAVSLVTFFLVSASPVDPVQANIGQAALSTISPEKLEQLQQYWHSDTPFFERYGAWISSFLQGDMGMSLRYNAPVADVIANRALNSLVLLAIAWLLSGIVGFIIGIVAGVLRDSWFDRVIKAYCFVLASTPTFWIALLFLVIFAVGLGWFPVGFSTPIGKTAADVTLWDALHHLALPAITLSLVGVANIALHTREKTVDVMQSDYVRFAELQGESKWSAVFHHGLRNLALPAITLQFAQIAEIFGGSILVEQVFSYPGLGQAAVTAGLGGDAALLAGIALISAALVFGGNLLANIIYGCIDPRMRKGELTDGA